MKRYMAMDQYGNTYHDIGPHPRQWLLDHFCRQRAQKMYRDPNARHVGWIIAGHWLEVFRVFPLVGNVSS